LAYIGLRKQNACTVAPHVGSTHAHSMLLEVSWICGTTDTKGTAVTHTSIQLTLWHHRCQWICLHFKQFPDTSIQLVSWHCGITDVYEFVYILNIWSLWLQLWEFFMFFVSFLNSSPYEDLTTQHVAFNRNH